MLVTAVLASGHRVGFAIAVGAVAAAIVIAVASTTHRRESADLRLLADTIAALADGDLTVELPQHSSGPARAIAQSTTELVRKLKVPQLYFVDEVNAPAAKAYLARNSPQAEVVALGGHAMFYDHAPAFNARLADFLARHP